MKGNFKEDALEDAQREYDEILRNAMWAVGNGTLISTTEKSKSINLNGKNYLFTDNTSSSTLKIAESEADNRFKKGQQIIVEMSHGRISNIKYKFDDKFHRMFKPAEYGFRYDNGLILHTVKYVLQNNEYRKEDFDEMMKSPLAQALKGIKVFDEKPQHSENRADRDSEVRTL